jgi:hypothetical protein
LVDLGRDDRDEVKRVDSLSDHIINLYI